MKQSAFVIACLLGLFEAKKLKRPANDQLFATGLANNDWISNVKLTNEDGIEHISVSDKNQVLAQGKSGGAVKS